MPKSDPPRKRRDQGQFVNRQTGPVSLQPKPVNRPDGDHSAGSFGMLRQEMHMGPLPAPSLVAGYDEVIDNGAERIMVMAEKEQEGRLEDNKSNRDFNKRAIKGYNFRGAFGQIAAFILVLAMLGLGYKLASDGQQDLAKTLFQYTIGAVVTVFLGGTISRAISGKKEGPPTPSEE
jgi:uncharacterized membrane protein